MDASIASLKPRYLKVPRFAAGSSESVDFLRREGYCVISSVLTEAETKHAMQLTWEYLEGLQTGIQRGDVSTWTDDRWPVAVHGAILPGLGIGQSAPQWFIRGRPGVKAAFAAVWGTDDLLTSFDGMSLWRPHQLNPMWKTNAGSQWLHVDQHPVGRPGFSCVQGLVSLLPMSEHTGGNVLIPRSHLVHADIPRLYPDRLARVAKHIDHFRFPANDPLLANCITAHLEPGDLLLWDSRTIHCSGPGEKEPPPVPELLRAVSLVCMMPRKLSDAKCIELRKQCVREGWSTTNWTDSRGIVIAEKNFPALLKADTSIYTMPPTPELNAQQLKLVGYTNEEIDASRALRAKL